MNDQQIKLAETAKSELAKHRRFSMAFLPVISAFAVWGLWIAVHQPIVQRFGQRVLATLDLTGEYERQSISPSEVQCKEVFVAAINGSYGPDMASVAQNCGGAKKFKTYLPLISGPRYSINGAALYSGDTVYSLYGMVVKKTTSNFQVIGLELPTVDISVGGKDASLVFGDQAAANEAFQQIALAVSQVQ